METKVVLYGASGHCKVIVDILQKSNVGIMTIIDDNPKINMVLDQPVSSSAALTNLKNVIVSIGDNAIRKKIVNQLHTNFITAIHPHAIISDYATIGEGSVVMAAAVANPAVIIGKHCIVNTAAVIDHDCVLGDYVHISPNAALAGSITVGEGTHIGIGASVIQNIKIGKWVTVGAGAVIINDIPDYAVVVGNPGRIIKYNIKNE